VVLAHTCARHNAIVYLIVLAHTRARQSPKFTIKFHRARDACAGCSPLVKNAKKAQKPRFSVVTREPHIRRRNLGGGEGGGGVPPLFPYCAPPIPGRQLRVIFRVPGIPLVFTRRPKKGIFPIQTRLPPTNLALRREGGGGVPPLFSGFWGVGMSPPSSPRFRGGPGPPIFAIFGDFFAIFQELGGRIFAFSRCS